MPTRIGGDARSRVRLALLALAMLALAVRLWGISWQLPWLMHDDEDHYPGLALRMVGSGDLDPRFFENPSLLIYWLVAQFWVLVHLASVLGGESVHALVTQPDVSFFYLVGRLNSAVFGAATVWATYWLGSLTVSRPIALLGALFLALNLLHVRDSHYATNDVAATFLLVLAAAAAARLWRNPTWSAYLVAGGLGGLAIGTKYNVGMLLLILLAAHALAWRQRSASPVPLGRLVAAGGAMILAFLATTPYALINQDEVRNDLFRQVGLASQFFLGQPSEAVPLLYLLTLTQAMGWLQVLLVVVGLGALLWRDRSAALLLSIFPIAYLLYMSQNSIFWVRLAIPLLPFLCLLAAAGCQALIDRLRPKSGPALAALGLLCLVQPTVAVVQHNTIVSREDTRVLAYRWVVEHLVVGTHRVAADQYGLRTPPWEPDQGETLVMSRTRLWRYDRQHFRERGYTHLALNSFVQDLYTHPRTALMDDDFLESRHLNLPRERRRSEQHRAQHTPLATFAPGVGGTSIPYQYDDQKTPFWNLGAWERPGPTVTIYALGGAASRDTADSSVDGGGRRSVP